MLARTISGAALLVALTPLAFGGEAASSPKTTCDQGSINTPVEAKARAMCLFKNISEICPGTSNYTQNVSRQSETWRVVSIPPNSACHSWEVVFRAEDGKVLKFGQVHEKALTPHSTGLGA